MFVWRTYTAIKREYGIVKSQKLTNGYCFLVLFLCLCQWMDKEDNKNAS